MNDLITAAQQALEALEWHYRQGHSNTLGGWRLKIDEKALRNLRAALAEPEQEPVANEIHGCHGGEGSTLPEVSQQEPVAWMISDPKNPKMRFVEWQKETKSYKGEWIKTPLYTAPPQRKPLTEEEIAELARQEQFLLICDGLEELTEIARAIERAYGIGDKDVHR